MTVTLVVWVFGVGLMWLCTPRARFAAAHLGRNLAYWGWLLAWPYTVVAAIVWAVRRECGW